MFKIESYVTPILLSYVDKYVRDFKPADAQVSLWGGGVALHNLVLKADVLQQEVSLPFTLVSGRIHELLIQVPWTKIMSEPIVVTIDTIECVLSLNPPTTPDEIPPSETPSERRQVVEAPPGYMQALVRRVVSNISLRVHHLIVKYVQDDIVLSLNVKHLAVDSADASWTPAFADIDQTCPVIRRLVRLDDFTLCLDRADSDGKIRFYQEPLLYRCQLDLRVLTQLVSATIRRATNISIQLSSSKLAWGVTNEQLVLLIRLLRERTTVQTTTPPPAKSSNTSVAAPLTTSPSNTAEPTRTESWSEWAWSWLPALSAQGTEESFTSAAPIPLHFSARLDCVALVLKIMETESANRKRARGIMELFADHAAVRGYVCSPTSIRVRFGARSFVVQSRGKCVCGHNDVCLPVEKPTTYLSKQSDHDAPWSWPDDDLYDPKIEVAEVADESLKTTADDARIREAIEKAELNPGTTQEPVQRNKPIDSDELWNKLEPLIYLDYVHDRTLPLTYGNPYENPPKDFEYSDWIEDCSLRIVVNPLQILVCTCLIHRVTALSKLLSNLPTMPEQDRPMRILTVEECDSLQDNLPLRRIVAELNGLKIYVHPYEVLDKPSVQLLVELPDTGIKLTTPLYPHRVCSAACQMPEDVGPLWTGARAHFTIHAVSTRVSILSPIASRVCARADVRAVAHLLLHASMFRSRESVRAECSLRIREANLCGSAARLQAAFSIPMSLIMHRVSLPLRHTALGRDALQDEDLVAIDLTLEDLIIRGYRTSNTNTYVMTLQSIRVTALHAPSEGPEKQAWVFSGSDAPTSSQYIRVAVQWCDQPTETSVEYLGIWAEPTAFCVDPLFIQWLAYKPKLLPTPEPSSQSISRSMTSSQYFIRRKTTPPSSSGRGASRSGAELVHVRSPRSMESSSEPSEKKSKSLPAVAPAAPTSWLDCDRLLELHNRLRRLLFHVDLGLVMVYVTMTTATAVDVASVRDAMERHAMGSQEVLAMSFGRFTLYSTVIRKFTWQDVRHDGPTFLTSTPVDDEDSFPWKLRFADVSCYTLEIRAGAEKSSKEKSTGLRSQLKFTHVAIPRTILDLVTSTLTLSVVTKQIHVRTNKKYEHKKHKEFDMKEAKMKYFTSGVDFKPSTLKEFVRGPASRKAKPPENVTEKQEAEPVPTYVAGPIVSLGVHLHADTPPIVVRLDQDQVAIVSTTLHCFNHIITLLQRPSVVPKNMGSGGSKTLIRSVSEHDEEQSVSEDSPSQRSELISIFEARPSVTTFKMKTFLWCQWVISRVTLYMATAEVKLAFDVDDIISTVDIQAQYNQLKVKIASATVRHYERYGSDEWKAEILGGRILEAREPSNTKEESHFMAVTITQAQISNLPQSWKEELNPKVLQQTGSDSMWEIYATLAPLEAVIQPVVLDNIKALIQEIHPESSCPLETEIVHRPSNWQWPYCYITAGGLRLLLSGEDITNSPNDDTFMILIGKVTVNPHPENPICRRPVNTLDTSFASATTEGRQYDVMLQNVSVKSAKLMQLVDQETSNSEMMKGTGSENPALKWTQPVISPKITPVLHSMDIGCVVAPGMFTSGQLTYGPAVEINLVSDCTFELGLAQLRLATNIAGCVIGTFSFSDESLISREDVKLGLCPYALILMKPSTENIAVQADSLQQIENTYLEEPEPTSSHTLRTVRNATDSGVDTVTSHSTLRSNKAEEVKKFVTVAFADNLAKSSDHFEVYITMGTIHVCVYVRDDGSDAVTALLPPADYGVKTPTPTPSTPQNAEDDDKPVKLVVQELGKESSQEQAHGHSTPSESRSLLETARNVDVAKSNLQMLSESTFARQFAGNVSLIQLKLHQPNLYYCRRKTNKTLQVSLFNARVGLGPGPSDNQWHLPLFSTAPGVADPLTDIPPALCTLKYSVPGIGVNIRGTVRMDVERPIMFEVCMDRIRRLNGIKELIANVMPKSLDPPEIKLKDAALCKLRNIMTKNLIDNITINSSQISLVGSEGSVGCDSSHWEISRGQRPERLALKGAVTALLSAAGPKNDCRRLVLQPLHVGFHLQAIWETWRRCEGSLLKREPRVKVGIDLDKVTFDLRPEDLKVVLGIKKVLREFMEEKEEISSSPKRTASAESVTIESSTSRYGVSFADDTQSDHYYKDDLRSGAFKIVSGGQLPMAYQVMLDGNCVSWKYPHPRAITRIVAFPLPGLDTEIEVVLELYNVLLERWELFTSFFLPTTDPREIHLYVPPPDSVFAMMWRFRTGPSSNCELPPFRFDLNRFMSGSEASFQLPTEEQSDTESPTVTAEQLSATLRVDSYFAPNVLPFVRASINIVGVELRVHCAQTPISSHSTTLEGYYVTKPLMRNHPMLNIMFTDALIHAQRVSRLGNSLLLKTKMQADIMDSSTGAMQPILEEVTIQAGTSNGDSTRVCSSLVHLKIDVPRVKTMEKLAVEWLDEYQQDASTNTESHDKVSSNKVKGALEGRIALWIENCSSVAMRLGQEGTDEVICLGAQVKRAYRWQTPKDPKKLRMALATPSADWRWSESIPFTPGTYKVRVETPQDTEGEEIDLLGLFVHVKVTDCGAIRTMKISGRVALANMLRHPVLFKIRIQCTLTNQWRTISSGELEPEAIGPTVITGSDADMVLKIKFVSQECGWSGDIPLKECPKENVPWLVKVPNAGDNPYLSVWCRVIRAKSDGRVTATLWPLYVLTSYLPLDTEVTITTESPPENSSEEPTTYMQTAPGHGRSIHLIAPGTTSARHSLAFHYTDMSNTVTQEAVPLYYGVTQTSVFDKQSPPSCADDVITLLQEWLEKSRVDAETSWPYSIVKDQWNGKWEPAQLQPRSDIVIRYHPIVVCGGCSLQVQLRPAALLCNASVLALTLRAHDAAPLCRCDAGGVVSVPNAALQKPFFISIEMGRETFVSPQLEICTIDPGRYGAPPPGQLALDRSLDFAILCGQKAALLTMHYELKEDINILGVASTYTLVNKLDKDILVSSIAMPNEVDHNTNLKPSAFKVVPPTKDGNPGSALVRFWLGSRWRGTSPSELRLYICLALCEPDTYPAHLPVPVVLAREKRKPVVLKDAGGKSIPVVIEQITSHGSCRVVVSHDPCPQLVIVNQSSYSLAIAQPVHVDDPTTSAIRAVPECHGLPWHVTIQPGEMTHYSTPAYCARYPPDNQPPKEPAITFLTFSRAGEELTWCPPVAIADGEQLLQLSGSYTLKIKVKTHPHSTLVELNNVDELDISASDIRKRLVGPIASKESILPFLHPDPSLTRTYATEKLLSAGYMTRNSLDNPSTLLVSEAGPSAAPKTTKQRVSMEKYDLNLCENSGSLKTIVSANSMHSAAFSVTPIEFEEDTDWHSATIQHAREPLRCLIEGVCLEVATSSDTRPLAALHLSRVVASVETKINKTRTILTISDIQIDNLQYDTGQYDFSVVLTTKNRPLAEKWPTLWNMFGSGWRIKEEDAKLVLNTCHDAWMVAGISYHELTEVEIKAGPLFLFIEDAFITSMANLIQLGLPSTDVHSVDKVAVPLRLRLLTIEPIDLHLTLHTSARMYIALDQSPLHLSAFKLRDMMTSPERLSHALTVHYLSAAILGAGWVVGGLELLGAPGALASRLTGASGGVRNVASTAAAALLRSLSAWAGSLARNLDLLAGDEEHSRRAAEARRRPPPSFVAGLMAGITNFAINILGAVGGLAHHPLVGIAVGESESSTTGLRRGLLGALTKPLSATADLVAYAGHGLLAQTGWDPAPQPRLLVQSECTAAGWRRDCVRWTFRLASLNVLAGFTVELDGAELVMLVSHKVLVVADPKTERIVEMIDFRFCSIEPHHEDVIKLHIKQRRTLKAPENVAGDDEDEYQISAAAMARVARYTGTEGATSGSATEVRTLRLKTNPYLTYALHALLTTIIHHNDNTHFSLL